MAVLIVCGVDGNGHRDIIAVEPMTEESRSSYGVLFQNLKDRGLSTPKNLSFQMLTPGWFRRSGRPSLEPRGSALQGAFRAEYSCLCAAEREESLCRGTKRKSG